MASISSELVAGIVGDFYEAAYDESRWQHAVEGLRQVWDGATICFALQNIKTHSGTAVHTGGVDESYHRSYFEEYARHNLIEQALVPTPPGTIFTNWNPVPHDVWFESRFWNEWMAPQDLHYLLGSKVQLFGDVMGTLQIQRGRQRSDFDAGDVAVLRQLIPAITRAAYLGHRIGTLRLEAEAAATAVAAQGIATIVVSADGRILHTSAAAETYLMRRDCRLASKDGQLSARDPATSVTLRRLIVDACQLHGGGTQGRGGDLLLRPAAAGDPAASVALSVGPLANSSGFGVPSGRHAVIFLRELESAVPEGFEDHLRNLFDLTPSEARLAALLTGGIALKVAAERQGIRFSTARSYLEGIFRKTRTNQQSQLVALLKSAQPLLRRN